MARAAAAPRLGDGAIACAARAVRDHRAARVDRLQRPRQRQPLPARVRRGDRCPAARHRVDDAYIAAGGSYYTVESHLSHLGGRPPATRSRGARPSVLGCDEKRLHLFHDLRRAGGWRPLATAEQMLLHVSAETGRAGPAGDRVAARVAEIGGAHSAIPAPGQAGRRIALERSAKCRATSDGIRSHRLAARTGRRKRPNREGGGACLTRPTDLTAGTRGHGCAATSWYWRAWPCSRWSREASRTRRSRTRRPARSTGATARVPALCG